MARGSSVRMRLGAWKDTAFYSPPVPCSAPEIRGFHRMVSLRRHRDGMPPGTDIPAAGALPIRTWPGPFPLGRENILPALLTGLLVAAALAWNAQAGLRWTVDLAILMLVPAVCLLLLLVYCTVRPNPVIADMTLYIGLWFIYPVFGTRLTYLANRAGFPLRDALFD